MAKAIDLSGHKFQRLTVISRVGTDGHRCAVWSCICDCGNKVAVSSRHLKMKNGTGSCGCIRNEAKTTHGHRKSGKDRSREYETWTSMIQRCENHNAINYKHYGGRGIKVCDRWRNSFENFLADMGLKPSPELSIERINNNGNYEPSNCKWATKQEQEKNKRAKRLKHLSI